MNRIRCADCNKRIKYISYASPPGPDGVWHTKAPKWPTSKRTYNIDYCPVNRAAKGHARHKP